MVTVRLRIWHAAGHCAQGTTEAVPGPFAGLGYPGLGGKRRQCRPEATGLVWLRAAGPAGGASLSHCDGLPSRL
jgi:hypothetical protein